MGARYNTANVMVTCISICIAIVGLTVLSQVISLQAVDHGDCDISHWSENYVLTGAAGDALARVHRSFNSYWATGFAPNTAIISERLCSARFEGQSAHPPVSSLFWVWGQFVAHSLVHTSLDSTKPMYVGENRFSSSHTASVHGSDGYPQQVNDLAPYLDAYAVYGFEDSWFASQLWDHSTGTMLVSHSKDNAEVLLPMNHSSIPHPSYMGGDVRANENVLLASVHSLWLREHNYWVTRLEDERPQWTAEHRYKTARRLVSGEIQAITYHEWLPILLGGGSSSTTRTRRRRRDCYRPKAEAVIYNEVATAALRFGHSMVNEQFERRHPLTKEALPPTELLDAFHVSAENGVLWRHGADQYLAGALMQESQQLDQVVTETLRTRLFNMTTTDDLPPTILDLVALNLARGRDHGLPSYQVLAAQLLPAESRRDATGSYEQLVGNQSPALVEELNNIYGRYRSGGMDLWLGLMLEKRTSNSMLGRIGSELIRQQFDQLRISDPHYYEWDKECRPWLEEISRTKLSTVLERVSSITKPRRDAFRMPPTSTR